MTRFRAILDLLSLALLLAAGLGTAVAAEVPRMSIEDLKQRLGDPSLVILDVRSPGDWQSSDMMVANAVRKDPSAVAAWAGELDRSKTLVLYCS